MSSNNQNNYPVPLDNFSKAIEYIQKEWSLDWKEARKLLRTAGTAIINEAAVREAIEMAKAYNLPLRAIAIIPTQQGVQPYVTADGFRWAFRTDPRGPKSIKTEIVRFPWEGNSDEKIAVAKATAEFADGSVYTAYGAASNAKKSHRDFTDEDLILLAETKAVRRCLVNAIAFPFRPVEDLLEEEEEQRTPTIEVRKPEVAVELEPKNIIHVLVWARKVANLTDEEISAILGTTDPVSEYGPNFIEAWQKLKQYVEERNAKTQK